jgi:hypothetical protein
MIVVLFLAALVVSVAAVLVVAPILAGDPYKKRPDE